MFVGNWLYAFFQPLVFLNLTNNSEDYNDISEIIIQQMPMPKDLGISANETELEEFYYDDELEFDTDQLTLTDEIDLGEHILEETENLTTSVRTQEKLYEGGTKVTTITTTTVEKYSDGSSSTKTQTQTITETKKRVTKGEDGKSVEIDPDAAKKAPRAEVTTPDKFIQDALKRHNELRRKHGAAPLVLSKDMCKVAQAWANKIAAQDKMAHSSSGYGENCFWGSNDVTDGNAPVDYWYSEIKDFDFKKIDHQKGTGHFTQIVWKDSKELGIAKANGKDGSTYVVANYDPPGNFIGNFAENVGKPN